MGMRVEPVAARSVQYGELVDVTLARCDREPRVPVHRVWDMQAVPVNDRRLGQLVEQVYAHALAPPHPDDWPEVRGIGRLQRPRAASQYFAPVAPYAGRCACTKGDIFLHRAQLDVDIDAGVKLRLTFGACARL